MQPVLVPERHSVRRKERRDIVTMGFSSPACRGVSEMYKFVPNDLSELVHACDVAECVSRDALRAA